MLHLYCLRWRIFLATADLFNNRRTSFCQYHSILLLWGQRSRVFLLPLHTLQLHVRQKVPLAVIGFSEAIELAANLEVVSPFLSAAAGPRLGCNLLPPLGLPFAPIFFSPLSLLLIFPVSKCRQYKFATQFVDVISTAKVFQLACDLNKKSVFGGIYHPINI